MKNILLTGSSSGFGKVTAQVLAADGHHVFATMRNTETKNRIPAQHLTDWAELHNLQLTVLDLDVTSDDSAECAMHEIAGRTGGKIDVLVNNAGVGYLGLNETLSVSQMERMFQVNVIGPDRMIKHVLPYMHQREKGLIINLSGTASRIPLPVMGAYSATKAALDALTISYYYELASAGIGIALVQPGMFPSTNLITNQPVPANPEVTDLYGYEMELVRESIVEKYKPGPFKPEPIEVAYAIRDIIRAPSAFRSLWTIVQGGVKEQSVRHINQATRELVDSFLQVAGVVHEVDIR
ncbi:SDR family NAD(P)-dependent oxidoreductase [Dyadobacter sp. CY261]|uniref:SDR family NAD(P)-dependent oxidoreductase n=1 Tax=Dyadobacter sp. CY261 TaxID=2907203 RepID=UPI001F468623|nr:SDR family NAD(P)-dependent oxidoreductase [Dyadobacter sp. CY261]MCF0072963.1 SDR family NAD(P)-dependent oxidoreductase [Dyadobacter sp. CY261]